MDRIRITVSAVLMLLLLCPPDGRAQQATPSPHGTVRGGLDCGACHDSNAWKPIKRRPDFDHNATTSFVLLGRHKQANCASCHLDLRFDEPKLATADCASCHVDVHQGQLGAECTMCHNALAFNEVNGLSLHARTSFPLTGAHLQLNCESCHVDDRGGAYAPLNTDCISCHQRDLAESGTVDHSGFPSDCQVCHGNLTWGGDETFDHFTASGGFGLLGAHLGLDCSGCHSIPDMALLFPPPAGQNDCVACHQTDYDTQHAGSGFPTACLECHNMDSWEGARFDHITASGGFVLEGAHAILECTACHIPPGMDLRFPDPANSNDCVACHQADYDAQHAGSGFPTACLDCHNINTWDATFDHVSAGNGFALVGAHTTLQCSACHRLPDMELLFPPPADTNDCIACHQSDYDQQHGASGFPTSCLDCHTVNSWQGATFDHSAYFPITSGRHAGTPCETCHDVPGNYQIFTCFNCHQHSQSRMDDVHSGQNGYVYDSNACYSCHPNGTKP